MDINAAILKIGEVVWGWPMVAFVLIACLVLMVALRFVQFRYFFHAWRVTFAPSSDASTKSDMTPFQAFVNALSSSIGNGSLAGVATAIYSGGPGAALWIFVFGFLAMGLRFSEAYLGTVFNAKDAGETFGGPFIYLKKVPGGVILANVFAIFFFLIGMVSGNAMQANSVSLSLDRAFGISPWYVAVALFLFVLYALLGGAHRIVILSEAITPIKVALFFISAFIVFGYHYTTLIPALLLIIKSGLSIKAFTGGAIGYTIQQAMRFGVARTINSSEAGLGTAAVFFGASGGKRPVDNGFMAMLGTFISANLVCFLLAWIIVASGVWNSGLTSTPLTSAAFETVFGTAGGWIVTFLAVTFGIGVLVAYSYAARMSWLFLTKNKHLWLFNIIFPSVALVGAVAKVDIIWNSGDIINACLIVMNMYGILWLLPMIRRDVLAYKGK
ncbi:sodium:alanine symporter family protein [Candidatus Babeliales bacterium]|nr:sodium:alanine symporter family protein [Candidatus Babeliales bacterium]